MGVITESMLRNELRKKTMTQYCVEKTDVITPSARTFLREKGIELIVGQPEIKESKQEVVQTETPKVEAPKAKYICEYTGAFFSEKPEHMTQLYSNHLVYKNHKRIIFRGKMDTFIAKLIDLQLRLDKNEKVNKDLEEVLKYARNIFNSEFMENELQDLLVFGMDDAEIREHSHHPQKYYKVDHLFAIDSKSTPLAVMLNVLRAESREVEISAVEAFCDGKKVERQDILRALNRLSSLIYIMMLKSEGGFYE